MKKRSINTIIRTTTLLGTPFDDLGDYLPFWEQVDYWSRIPSWYIYQLPAKITEYKMKGKL